MMPRILPLLLLMSLIACQKQAPEISQWRGPDRDGIYHETNLLKEWPAEGPELLWHMDSIGDGYGSPVISSDGIYVTGAIDSTGYLYALELNGKLRWSKEYGKEWVKNFPGSRAAPTVYDEHVFICSGMGELMCIRREDGETVWRLNMIDDLNGVNTVFGYSQSVLVDENNVYCSPGGKDTNVVALNRLNGDLVWVSNALGQKSGFCSPQIYTYADKEILLTYSELAVIALDSKSGELLWTYKNDSIGNVHCNTPLLVDDHVYLVDGDGNMGVKLMLSSDGLNVKELWRNKSFDNAMGGFVKINQHLIATGHGKKYLKSLNTESGLISDSIKIGRGSTIYADSMIYVYNERGQVHLVKENEGQLKQISSFKITKGTKQHFSHPVIHKGILYIRRGRTLMAYDIRKQA